VANRIPRDIQEQAAQVGAEVYPAQGGVCTRGSVDSDYRWRVCSKPAVYNVARLTTNGWRMDDMCVDHLATYGIQVKESRVGG
jgi:hypothetical protein